MIVDRIEKAHLYAGVDPRLAAALTYLRNTDFSHLPTGRHDIEGFALYAIMQHYTTKPREKGRWETHKKYVDVQYILEGAERMGYTDVRALHVITPYDEAKDVELFDGAGDFLLLPAGDFMVLMPEEAHMPGIEANVPLSVKKVVVKVRWD